MEADDEQPEADDGEVDEEDGQDSAGAHASHARTHGPLRASCSFLTGC